MKPELFKPVGTPNGALIIIAHGSDGMHDNARGPWASMIRLYAKELAQKGFLVSVPDYFSMTNTTPPETSDQIVLGRNTWQAAIADTLVDARKLPGVDAQRVGLLGFSLGGHLCLRLRASAQVLVSYFAPELDGLGSPNGRPVRVMLHHGTGDKLVTFVPNAGNIEHTLKAEKTIVKLIRYEGAGHGFVGADPANTDASKKSKAATLEFFATHL